jgi:diguanylate cyclase
MPAFTNPTDVARETLKLLSARKLAPTPENYQAIYHEIAGTKATQARSKSELALLKALQALVRQVPEMESQFKGLAKALGAGDAHAVEAAFIAL